ncbi:hypothetical protein PG2T_03540 [Immundisolibacter cernigliae]|uniref:Sulfate transporter CysZ n=1 Tax=Immundisolibacter cernigliae TaxID=1810504 RepID=A0A1B1YRL3_9GAMM|nr:EI24 domain-containing protein [Immundisolibacter cernigliae]ANX03352.1 hypothetical protein PG2T_03540 [Immundisolibacter cernigliae]
MTMPLLGHPLSGPACLWRGFRCLFDRRWRSLVLAPLAINALLFGAGSVWAAGRVAAAVRWLQDALPGWLDWLAFLAWPLFGLGLLLVFVYAFTALANLIGAPFNVILARRVSGDVAPPAGGWLREATQAMLNELRKLRYFLVRAVPLGLLLWVPGVNLVAGPLWLLLGRGCWRSNTSTTRWATGALILVPCAGRPLPCRCGRWALAAACCCWARCRS